MNSDLYDLWMSATKLKTDGNVLNEDRSRHEAMHYI